MTSPRYGQPWTECRVVKVERFSVEDRQRVQLTLTCGHQVWRKVARAKVGSTVVCWECSDTAARPKP